MIPPKQHHKKCSRETDRSTVHGLVRLSSTKEVRPRDSELVSVHGGLFMAGGGTVLQSLTSSKKRSERLVEYWGLNRVGRVLVRLAL